MGNDVAGEELGAAERRFRIGRVVGEQEEGAAAVGEVNELFDALDRIVGCTDRGDAEGPESVCAPAGVDPSHP